MKSLRLIAAGALTGVIALALLSWSLAGPPQPVPQLVCVNAGTSGPYIVCPPTGVAFGGFSQVRVGVIFAPPIGPQGIGLTSTGSTQASVTVGDTNATSTTTLTAGVEITAAKPLQLPHYTIATTLPVCGASLNYSEAVVTDAEATPVYLNTITGGATSVVRVMCTAGGWIYD